MKLILVFLKYVFPFSLWVALANGPIEDSDGLIVFSFLFLICYYVYMIRLGVKNRIENKKKQGNTKATKDKIEHYKSAGLSDEEIVLFRETMATLQQQIKGWEQAVKNVPKLKAIDLRTNGIKSSKALFKEIVKEPKRMIEASDFIYKHLPNISELAVKYEEITQHEVKGKETIEMLSKSAAIIDALSEQIKKDYIEFVSNDLHDLEVGLSMAKRTLAENKMMEKQSDELSATLPDFSEYLKEEEHVR